MKKPNKSCRELERINKFYNPTQSRIQHFGVPGGFAKSIMCHLACFANQYRLSGPDLISSYNKCIIGVEHYEYDASKKTKKGSKERQEVERANSKFLQEAYTAAQGGKGLTREYQLDINASVDTLKENFLNNFRKHKQKIYSYKENLEEIYRMKNVPIWFISEDTSVNGPMFNHGSTIIHNQPNFPLLPILYEDVQKEILESNIAGIIMLSTFPISNYVVIVKNSPQSLNDLTEYYQFSEDLPIHFFNDLTYGFHSFCAFDTEE